MEKKIKIRQGDMIFLVVVVFLLGFVFGSALIVNSIPPTYGRGVVSENTVTMLLPAVDSEGNGVVATLYTTVKPGTGKIFLDSSSVLNYIDTQLSSRIAAEAGAGYVNVDMDTIDVEYTIKVNASIVEGPSAGAAMALSVVLALENRTADGIAITGAINPDGTIGKVGSVPEKAKAARDHGAKIFLVPKGQLSSEESRRTRTCSLMGSIEVCRIYYTTETVDIGKILNITVYEVGDLGEAFFYFNRTI